MESSSTAAHATFIPRLCARLFTCNGIELNMFKTAAKP